MFTVCHMFVSLDGKIDGDFFAAPEAAPALAAYGAFGRTTAAQAILYGTTTMLGAMLTEKWEAFPLSPLPCPGRTGSM